MLEIFKFSMWIDYHTIKKMAAAPQVTSLAKLLLNKTTAEIIQMLHINLVFETEYKNPCFTLHR